MQNSHYLDRPVRREDDVHPPRQTPWGAVQVETRLAPGIWLVETAGHGGIWLAPERRKLVPDYVVKASFLKTAQWWEEDVDQCWPRLIFGAELGMLERERALKFLERYAAEPLARYLADGARA